MTDFSCKSLIGSVALSMAMATTAVQAAEVPRGIYCSCPGTTLYSDSVLESVADLQYVDGFLVRIAWKDINPAEGVYDWSLLEEQLQRAEAYDKKISLAILNGPSTPDWVYDAGAQSFDYTLQGTDKTMPIAWDLTYLLHWWTFISELGANYADHERISLVHMTNATTNGLEMQLNLDASLEQQYRDMGYSNEMMVASWQLVLFAFAIAFPDKALDVEVHPVFGDVTIAEQVVEFGEVGIGERFGTFGAWWTLHNATNIYPEMYDILMQQEQQGYSTIQLATTSAQMGGGIAEYLATLDYAWDTGIRYMEVWNADLLNPELTPFFAATAMDMEAEQTGNDRRRWRR